MFVYFRKDTRKFSHTAPFSNGGDWLYEYELPNGKLDHDYILKDDDTIEEGDQLPVSNSPIITEYEFNLQGLRRLRDTKLQETDWWAVSDRNMTDAQKNYRQQLRDITKLYSNVGEAVWPEMPS
jgi:hypothetical protein